MITVPLLSQRDSRLFISAIPTYFGAITISLFTFERKKSFLAFFAIHNYCSSSKSRMFMRMVRTGKYLQVLDSIIFFVSIYMMNSLIKFKFSMKILLHNISMFINFLFSKVKKNISSRMSSFSTFPTRMVFTIVSFYLFLIYWMSFSITALRTIFTPPFFNHTGFCIKFCFTELANYCYHSSSSNCTLFIRNKSI